MYAFNLEACINGAKIQTKSGKTATFIKHEPNKTMPYYPLQISIDGCICLYTKAGTINPYYNSDDDLVMTYKYYGYSNIL